VQAVNIYFKGTLIVDIPADVRKNIKHRNRKDVYHDITVAKNSDLFAYGQVLKFRVNSSHHQAINEIGKALYQWHGQMMAWLKLYNSRTDFPGFLWGCNGIPNGWS